MLGAENKRRAKPDRGADEPTRPSGDDARDAKAYKACGSDSASDQPFLPVLRLLLLRGQVLFELWRFTPPLRLFDPRGP